MGGRLFLKIEGIEGLYNSYTAKVGSLLNIFGLNFFLVSEWFWSLKVMVVLQQKRRGKYFK